jgi:hypothetical protein
MSVSRLYPGRRRTWMGNGLRYSERGPIRLADTALPILSDIVPRATAFAPPEATFLRVSDDPLGAWHGSAHSPRITGHPNVLMVL